MVYRLRKRSAWTGTCVVEKPLSYFQPREITAQFAGVAVKVITRPGFARWDLVSPASRLLSETIELPQKKAGSHFNLLFMGLGHCALGAALEKRFDSKHLWITDTTITALEMARRTMQANKIEGAHFIDDPLRLSSFQESIDLVVMELPKGRAFTRRWLSEAHRALQPGGALYLAGSKKEGIKTAIDDAQALFGNAIILGYKKGCRVARMVKNKGSQVLPKWIEEPGIQPDTWIEHNVEIQGEQFHLCSLPGVFSAGSLDEGTSLLLTDLPSLASARVLDAGCGYGIIGLYAWRMGAVQVDMIDNHLLSITCAKENIRRDMSRTRQSTPIGGSSLLIRQIEESNRIRAFAADFLEISPDDGYTHILSNPPFHAGQEVDLLAAQALITRSFHLLQPGGHLILVANRFLRYDRPMKSLFGNVTYILETGKYHILASIK